MNQFDQGTILYGVRSNKYPGTRCYGIIISASCDIAQEKVQKLYYLIAVDAKDWFQTNYAYLLVYAGKIKAEKNKFAETVKTSKLDASYLQDFSRQELISILKSEVPNEKSRAKIVNAYDKLKVFYAPEISKDLIRNAIRVHHKPIEDFLEDVRKERILHYYYLPQVAYRNSGEKNKGLIVDLQEIDYLAIEDARRIEADGIDYLNLPSDTKHRERLQEQFWLEEKDDFVEIEGSIISPWREHLMQSFSHGFIRIGLDGASKTDFQDLVSSITEEK